MNSDCFIPQLCEENQKILDGMEIRVNCEVPGDPISKQRPRFAVNRKGSVYTPKHTKEAERAIAWSIRASHRELFCDSDSAFGVILRFFAKNYQRRDVDNMTKLILDACNGIVWGDDSQVIDIHAFVERGSNNPRTEIFIVAYKESAHPLIECPVCKIQFKTYPSWPYRIYCSSRCFGLAIRNGVNERCSACGKDVYVRPCERIRDGKIRKSHFCSKECYWDSLRRQNPDQQPMPLPHVEDNA